MKILKSGNSITQTSLFSLSECLSKLVSQGFQNLKKIYFYYCDSLVCIPDLSCTPNLMELRLRNCFNLEEAHESIGNHAELRVVVIIASNKLSYFPALRSKTLQILRLEGCRFESFPDIPHELEGLEVLSFGLAAIKEVPASIEYLVSLRKMCLDSTEELISLPSGIYKLQNLEELQLYNCKKLTSFPKYEESADPSMKTGFPKLRRLDIVRCNLSEVEFLENLSCAPLLERLDLRENNITSLPMSLHKRDHLSMLRVRGCGRLREIPELPPSVIWVDAENCCSLKNNDYLTSFDNFVRRGLAMARTSPCGQEGPGGRKTPERWYKSFISSFDRFGQERPRYSIFIPGCQMPEWVLPVEGDSISFMASENLYHKFLGLSLCIVVCEFNRGASALEIKLLVNGQNRGFHKHDVVELYSDHIWLHYFVNLRGEVDFGQIEGRYVQFSLGVRSKIVKKWGLRIICKQLNDDLEKGIRDNKLMDPALLCEIDHESIDSEAEISLTHEDCSSEADPREDLQDRQMSTGEHSHHYPKERNHELLSHEACDGRPFGILNRLAEMSMAMFARCFCC